jgi:tight adherence protein C
MDAYLPLTAGLVVGIIGMIVVALGVLWIRSDELSPRLRAYITDPEKERNRWMAVIPSRARDLTGSMTSRVIVPTFRRLGAFLSRLTPVYTMDSLRKKLYIAENPFGIGPGEFFGACLAFVLLALTLSVVMLRRNFSPLTLLLSALITIALIIFPILWLRLLVNAKQNEIRKGFPSALDMLSVCVDAGLGFDQALKRMSDQWKTRVAIEFGRVVSEMEMGISRREAMRGMADRLEVSEISSFVAIILQSEQLGSSIADTLHAQADQMRIERRYRAEEKARTIPIKMLLPLAFLIFPAILAILLGPAIPQLLGLIQNF